MVAQDELVSELRRDLQDGDDLAQAARLVSDAVERRIRRIQRSMDMVDDDTAPALQRRLETLVERYRVSLSSQSDALKVIIEEYQPRLAELAEELEGHVAD